MSSEARKFLEEIKNKAENDTNSYSKINTKIIQALEDAGKTAVEVMGKKVITEKDKSPPKINPYDKGDN